MVLVQWEREGVITRSVRSNFGCGKGQFVYFVLIGASRGIDGPCEPWILAGWKALSDIVYCEIE
jgi:hypothetical protein